MDNYKDLALVIAWPEIPTRGDEHWMKFLKRIGVVKNLHFKVGHAAIVLVDYHSGDLAYYDFGRYVTPRGYGRARSTQSDPRLRLDTKARVDENGQIANIRTILDEMHLKRDATHGAGVMYFSIADGISFKQASAFAERLVYNGPIKYGAIAGNCNSCSRYVAQVLLTGFRRAHPNRLPLCYPESFKASPMSNVVNAASRDQVYMYDANTLSVSKLSRFRSFCYQARLIAESLSRTKVATFPLDHIVGHTQAPSKPSSVPDQAQWLGGIGEGAWYVVEPLSGNTTQYRISRYGIDGRLIYSGIYESEGKLDADLPYQLTHDTEYRFATLEQHGTSIRLSMLTSEDTISNKHLFEI